MAPGLRIKNKSRNKSKRSGKHISILDKHTFQQIIKLMLRVHMSNMKFHMRGDRISKNRNKKCRKETSTFMML
jgi:hypothetical protein